MKKFECGQKNLSVLSTSVGVECGVWSVECDSAVSGEPPQENAVEVPACHITGVLQPGGDATITVSAARVS